MYYLKLRELETVQGDFRSTALLPHLFQEKKLKAVCKLALSSAGYFNLKTIY